MTVTHQGAFIETLDRLLIELRPKLHRYCARMMGSVIDGEDVLQDTLLKALEASSQAGNVTNVEAWLFRVAHNSALDFLRARTRREAFRSDEDLEMIVDRTRDPLGLNMLEETLPKRILTPRRKWNQ